MDQLERLGHDYDAISKQVDDATAALLAAQNDAEREDRKAKLATLRAERDRIHEQISDAAAAQAADPVAKLQGDFDTVTTQIETATAAVQAAKSDADRQAATAKLAALQGPDQAADPRRDDGGTDGPLDAGHCRAASGDPVNSESR
jgi:seryl-tRNA synthetase